ncbi:MAG TPA: pitrilysin family protein, partial [Thermoanaerobaculia bacterium]|nr:pitrilysin family protein [Thermoanaerobaculia bacterium]
MSVATADAAVRLPGEATVERLANGLTVCLLSNRVAPVVTTALWYRAGTRDETAAEAGAAHFLEHMMFKGWAAYGPGDVDRRTQSLGGDNNAFTSHDATCYHFRFAPDRWHEALAIEADRMAGLTLDRREVASERRVILEEVAMYDADPWDSLDQKVHAARFPGHPYGLPVLGTPKSLRKIDGAVLAAFHRRSYRPGNAVLVVAGDVGPEAIQAVEEAFGGLGGPQETTPAEAAGLAPAGSLRFETNPPGETNGPRGQAPPLPRSSSSQRVLQHKGEVARLMVSLPAPAGDAADSALLRLATT